jgi:hypothetical protein
MSNNDAKEVRYIGKFTCSPEGLRKIADWIEKETGSDGDCEVNVSSYRYEGLVTLGYSFEEEK